MRTRKTSKGLTVNAIAGPNVVVFGLNLSDDERKNASASPSAVQKAPSWAKIHDHEQYLCYSRQPQRHTAPPCLIAIVATGAKTYARSRCPVSGRPYRGVSTSIPTGPYRAN